MTEWTAAAEAFGRALRCRADWIEARIGRGACLLHVGRFGEALSQFELALDTAPSQPAAFGRAVALQLLRRQEKAVEAYRDIRGKESYENVICLAIECGDLFSARRITRELLEMDPSSRVGLLAKATLAFYDGDMQRAARSCTRLLEIDPENVEAWLNLQYASQRRVGELTQVRASTDMPPSPQVI
jgi:tetratricopeptide (TPR) repeat protein